MLLLIMLIIIYMYFIDLEFLTRDVHFDLGRIEHVITGPALASGWCTHVSFDAYRYSRIIVFYDLIKYDTPIYKMHDLLIV